MPNVIVGTAGHIDHGKTALVKALTGIDADRFKEEKERGITIDIGFANLEIDPDTTIGFVDVPGHERFVKNMLAGIGGIDIVMLIVAADESIMPQTREHLEICSLLHIARGVTVITKTDTVDEEIADLVELEVRDYLKPTFLGDGPVVRVSAQTGAGIPELVETLRRVCETIRPKDDSKSFRLPIDRCFTIKGFGTVVTGTLIAGAVRKEDEVELLPSGQRTRIRGIQVHGRPSGVVTAGQRTALNLQDLEVAEIERGMLLTEPGLFEPTSMFDCHLELIASAPGPIRLRKRIRFHVGTAEIMGYVTLLGQDRLEPGDSAFVQIRLEDPTFALPGDRFIIRQYSPMITIGGGEILEQHPRRHRRKDEKALERLRVFKDGQLDDRLMVFIEDAGLATLSVRDIVGKTGVPPATLQIRLDHLVQDGKIRLLSESPSTVVSETAFRDAVEQTLARVLRFHRDNPLAVGISREELKTRIFEGAPNLTFQAALDELIERKQLSIAQEVIHSYGRTVTLNADEENIQEKLTAEFLRGGLKIPPPKELIRKARVEEDTARKILRLMVREGVLVKISDDLLIHREAMDGLIDRLRALKNTDARLGVGEFKDLAGVSRKYAIPILEYLDRQRVTRRVGDSRVIL